MTFSIFIKFKSVATIKSSIKCADKEAQAMEPMTVFRL